MVALKTAILSNILASILTALLILLIGAGITFVWSYRFVAKITDNVRMNCVSESNVRHSAKKEERWVDFVLTLTKNYTIMIAVIELLVIIIILMA